MGSQRGKFLFIKQNSYIILLCIIWVVAVFVVDPSGEFPLNDDWSYCRVVKNLVEEGRFGLGGWTSMPLAGQALWGALFCLPFGFSFLALRISTLVLGLIGVLSGYGILRQVHAEKQIAFLGALVLALNPLYFQHAFTFMTDIPFTALALVSIYLYMKGFRLGHGRFFIWGSLFAAWASLIRQLGIVIPLVFAGVFLLKNGLNRENVRRISGNLLIALGPFLLFNLWLQYSHGLPAKYNAAGVRISRALNQGFGEYINFLLQRASGAFIYIAIFVLPLLILLVPSLKKSLRRKELYFFLGGLFFMALSLTLVWNNRSMPLLRNVLFDLGLGPPHLRDVYVLGLPNWPRAPVLLWYFVTLIGIIGGSFLVLSCFRALKEIFCVITKRIRFDVDSFFLFWVIILNFIPIIIIGYYDRYLVFFPVLVFALLLRQFPLDGVKRRALILGPVIFVVLVFLLFSLGATHDYMSWNRARWQALDFLTEDMGIPPNKIDGGFEFNGWHLYDPGYIESPEKSYWWIEDDDYAVTFGPMIGYDEVRRFPFKRWIPFETAFIHVMKKGPRPK